MRLFTRHGEQLGLICLPCSVWNFFKSNPFKPLLHFVPRLSQPSFCRVSFLDPHFTTCLLPRSSFCRVSLFWPSLHYETYDITFSSLAHAWPPYLGQHRITFPLPRPNITREVHFLLLDSCVSPLSTRRTSFLHVALSYAIVPPIVLCLSLACSRVKQQKTYCYF